MLDSRFSPQVTQNEDNGRAIGFCLSVSPIIFAKSVLGVHLVPHFGGRGGRIVGRWLYHSIERWWHLKGSPLWPMRYLFNYSTAICYRMLPTLKWTGMSHFWAKFGKRLTDVSQVLTRSWRDMGSSYSCESIILICRHLSTMHEGDRQTATEW